MLCWNTTARNDPIPGNLITDPIIIVGMYWVRAVYDGNAGNNPVTTALQSFQITPATLDRHGYG
jgi:hypothetical protein